MSDKIILVLIFLSAILIIPYVSPFFHTESNQHFSFSGSPSAFEFSGELKNSQILYFSVLEKMALMPLEIQVVFNI